MPKEIDWLDRAASAINTAMKSDPTGSFSVDELIQKARASDSTLDKQMAKDAKFSKKANYPSNPQQLNSAQNVFAAERNMTEEQIIAKLTLLNDKVDLILQLYQMKFQEKSDDADKGS